MSSNTLKDRIFDRIDEQIELREKELESLKDMRERLKSMNERDLFSILGVVSWFYELNQK